MILQVKPYMRAWVTDLAQKVAAAIGWPDTLKAIEIGMEYAKANPFPDDPDNVPPAQPPAVEPPAAGDDKPQRPEPPVQSGARLVSVKAIGSMISVTVDGFDGWPVKGGKKDTFGKLMIGTRAKPSGEYVDALTKSQMRGGRKTLENAFGSGAHSLDVQRGETVMVWVRSWDGRETNKLPFVWVWEST